MKPSITKSTSKISRMKPKTINITADEEFIENNLIDLPFIYYYKSKQPVTSVKYEWISSQGKKKSIEVRSSELGVPTSYEYDVLLALLRIYIRQNDNTIICSEEAINDLTELDNKVHFSYRELISEMGYKDYSVKLKNKIDISIERLCDTNIYNIGGGIYNPLTKEYITDYKYQIGILSGYSAYSYITVENKNGEEERVLDKKSLKDKVTVKIDLFFLKNLLCGKGKISDKNLRLSLKSDVSRRLYLILNKWRNGRTQFFLKYETLYERIPLTNDKDDYYRKRRLKDACKELTDNNFISNYNMNKCGVDFMFDEGNQTEMNTTSNSTDLLTKYNSYDEIVDTLVSYGITDETLRKHFKLHQIPYIQALLRLIEDRKDKINNPLSYIFQGLITPYEDIDKKYFNK